MIQCVGALVLMDRDVLLGLRAPHRSYPRCWDIIGGHVEDGETAEVALVRELQEEIGIAPTAWNLLSALRFMDGNLEAVLQIFEVREWQGQPRLRNDEHTEIRWHGLLDACDLQPLALPEYVSVFRSVLRAMTSRRPRLPQARAEFNDALASCPRWILFYRMWLRLR